MCCGAAVSEPGGTWPQTADWAGRRQSGGARRQNGRQWRRDPGPTSPPHPYPAGWSRGTHTPPRHQYHTEKRGETKKNEENSGKVVYMLPILWWLVALMCPEQLKTVKWNTLRAYSSFHQPTHTEPYTDNLNALPSSRGGAEYSFWKGYVEAILYSIILPQYVGLERYQ